MVGAPPHRIKSALCAPSSGAWPRISRLIAQRLLPAPSGSPPLVTRFEDAHTMERRRRPLQPGRPGLICLLRPLGDRWGRLKSDPKSARSYLHCYPPVPLISARASAVKLESARGFGEVETDAKINANKGAAALCVNKAHQTSLFVVRRTIGVVVPGLATRRMRRATLFAAQVRGPSRIPPLWRWWRCAAGNMTVRMVNT